MKFLRLLFQPRCIVCRRSAAANAHWCLCCLREFYFQSRHSHPNALFRYEGEAVKRLLWELRGRRHRYALRLIGKILPKKEFGDFHFVIPAPQNREPGGLYAFGECLASVLGARFVGDLLEKRAGHRQHGKRAEERLDGENFVRMRRVPTWIRGSSILLLDDVGTTGTTIAQCATLLRIAGAQRIEAFFVARRTAETRDAVIPTPVLGCNGSEGR